MNRNFAMMVLQTVSHARAEACPPPCVNTTNKLQPFGHRRGNKIDAPDTIRAASVPKSACSLSQCCRCCGLGVVFWMLIKAMPPDADRFVRKEYRKGWEIN